MGVGSRSLYAHREAEPTDPNTMFIPNTTPGGASSEYHQRGEKNSYCTQPYHSSLYIYVYIPVYWASLCSQGCSALKKKIYRDENNVQNRRESFYLRRNICCGTPLGTYLSVQTRTPVLLLKMAKSSPPQKLSS